MKELRFVKKVKNKRIIQMNNSEFSKGKWCNDNTIIPHGKYIEFSYNPNSEILVIQNTNDLEVKNSGQINSEKEVEENV